ncbi:Rrf2 family transcriptional regulator [Actinopolymorpha sp. B17G11]|uniref:RrF2 family transcriptional regulator n=1 Tax=Actinopolymorpha sp. B17G11 TaxID=3160861 RepID=UPI0032E3EE2A
MKLSAGVEWALHCCVVLSQATDPVPVGRLATFHDVSKTYLAKHMQALVRAGLVSAAEGRDGGYLLARDPAHITVLDVVGAIEGHEPAFRCTEIRQRGPLPATPGDCERACAIARAMATAEAAWRTSLEAISVADLVGDVDRDTSGQTLPRLRGWLRDSG